MPLRSFSLISFLTFAGFCFGQSSPESTPAIGKTGIDGLIMVAPSHPGPARPGIENSRPLANTTFIAAKTGSSTEFTTDEQGHFRVLLEPGQYSITRKGQGKIGRCGPFDAFVVSGQLTHVEWQCDSGMR